jgi:chaperonin GroES
MNTSGFAPLDLRVLILPDPVEEKRGSILLPDEVKEKEGWAQAKGTLIAAGENAWEEAAARSSNFTRPKPGDRILFGKYSGQQVKGADGNEYRIMNDEDVIARLEE